MRLIGGIYRGKKLLTPPSRDTRPTSDRVREMLFNVLFHNPAFSPSCVQGKAVLDVFAGSGAMGLEALSRGATSAVFIENNPRTLKALRQNVATLNLPPGCVRDNDVLSLGKAVSPFNLVFLDPPYEQNLVEPSLDTLIKGVWIAPGATVVIETGKAENITLPPSLSLILERLAGPAKILFCKLQEPCINKT